MERANWYEVQMSNATQPMISEIFTASTRMGWMKLHHKSRWTYYRQDLASTGSALPINLPLTSPHISKRLLSCACPGLNKRAVLFVILYVCRTCVSIGGCVIR